MGYAWHGVCYPDSAKALEAFANDLPSASGNGVVGFASPPSIAGSVVSWTVTNVRLDGSASTTTTGTTALQSCTDTVAQYPVQSILFYLALLFAAFAGFRTGFRP